MEEANLRSLAFAEVALGYRFLSLAKHFLDLVSQEEKTLPVEFYTCRAQLRFLTKEPDKALEDIDIILLKTSNDLFYIKLKGLMLLSLERYEESLRYFDYILDRSRDNLNLYYSAMSQKFIILRQLKGDDIALSFLDKCLADKDIGTKLTEMLIKNIIKS